MDNELKLKFSYNQLFLIYFAGFFDAKAILNLKENNIVLTIIGNMGFLNELKEGLGIGNIYRLKQTVWKASDQEILQLLVSIVPFLIIKRRHVEFIIKYLKKNYVLENNDKLFENFNKFKEISDDEIDFFEYTNNDWIFLYLVGYFDAKSRINIVKYSKSSYWLKISLKSDFDEILISLKELSGLGHIIPSGTSFKWILTGDDSFELIRTVEKFLLYKSEHLKIVEQFHDLINDSKINENEKLKQIKVLKTKLRQANMIDQSKKSKKKNPLKLLKDL